MRFDTRSRNHLLAACLTLGMAGLSHAQDAAPPAPAPAGEQPKAEPAGEQQRREGQQRRGEFRRADPQRMLERMQASFRELNLSDDQKTKIQAVADKAKSQLETIVKETEGKEPRERATKLREATGPIREEMMAVLDETQRQKLRELTEAARAARGNRNGGGDGTPMLQNLKANLEKLGLSDDQKKRVETLLADTEKQFAAIRAEAGQPAPAGTEREARRAKFRELMHANRKQLNEILTDEQRQKLRELSPQRAGRPGADGTTGQPGNAPAAGEQREPL